MAKDRRDFDRRKFLVAAAASAAAAMTSPLLADPQPTAELPRSELEEMTIAQIQQDLRAGRFTSLDLVQAYSRRIEAIDRSGPRVNSIIEMNPEADAMAEQLDRERAAGRIRGPLHGIPIVIKDNIDTGDRMRTSAGSLALADSSARKDAFIVARLREAGMVLLGKTNLSEWANFRSTHSTSGWCARGGQTRNPYALDRNPCGSSSGSAVAVAANLAAAAVGTETDGSIVCPASACSLVGIKPTLGLVSRSGIVPIAHSQDTAGPMARTVADAAALLSALAGIDPSDSATQSSEGKSKPDYTSFLDPEGLKDARIGIARKYSGFNQHVDRILTDGIDVMRRAGTILVDPADMETTGKYDDSEFEVLLFEFKADLETYLATRPDVPYKTLADLIKFNEENRDREMPWFGQEIFLRAQEKGALTSKDYRAALKKNLRLSRTEGIDAVMKKHRLDALVAPTGGPAWPTDLLNGDHYSGGFSSAAAVAGYPHVTVPAGFVSGLPVGISFFGAAWSEPVLIRLAYAFEQATRARRSPEFLPTIRLEPKAGMTVVANPRLEGRRHCGF
jgi:amidase